MRRCNEINSIIIGYGSVNHKLILHKLDNHKLR